MYDIQLSNQDDVVVDRDSQSKTCKRLYKGNKDALGWALDGIARMVIFASAAVFLSTSLINLAKRSVGCSTEIPEGSNKVPECNEKIYGLRPSSILTVYGTILGLVVAVSLPFVGALLDHTHHRKAVGQISALVQVILVLSLCFLNENNFFIMMIVQVISQLAGWVHTLVIFAYLPELTDDSNLLIKWTANFHFLQYATLVAYLPLMVGVLYLLGVNDDDVMSARIANGTAGAVSVILLGWTWTRLMRPRPALQELPDGASILTIGFVKVWHTGHEIRRKYRGLMWFFMNVSLVEAAQSSLAVISLTFMTDVLKLSVTQNGIAIFTLFIFASIGTLLGQKSVKVMNPIRSSQLCNVYAMATTGAAAGILNRPGQQIEACVFAALWGIGAGWKNTVERFTVTQLIPKDQDAELMGLYLFSSQVLVWCPSLIYTTLNESGYDPRIGLAMLMVFFFGGLTCLFFISYEKALESVNSVENHIVASDEKDETITTRRSRCPTDAMTEV